MALYGDAMKALRAGLLVLAAALMLIGCGEDTNQASPGASSIQLESPALGANGVISPQVSCGAGTIWLPLKWGSLPSETEELILYFGRFKEEAGNDDPKARVSFAAMITEINPELRGMAANTLPAESEYRYFISVENCPPVRNGQHFLVEVFAMDERREVPQNDRFAIRLAEEALGVEQFATRSSAASELREEALATDRFIAIYAPL